MRRGGISGGIENRHRNVFGISDSVAAYRGGIEQASGGGVISRDAQTLSLYLQPSLPPARFLLTISNIMVTNNQASAWHHLVEDRESSASSRILSSGALARGSSAA